MIMVKNDDGDNLYMIGWSHLCVTTFCGKYCCPWKYNWIKVSCCMYNLDVTCTVIRGLVGYLVGRLYIQQDGDWYEVWRI